jgi:hypothetical protein
MLQNFGRASLADYVGDWVIYRSLEPLDKRLPGFKAASYRMGLNDDHIPRKQDPEYAKAAVWFLEEAHNLRDTGRRLSELLFVGDTLFNDGQAFRNMVKVSGWRGTCFIGADRLEQEETASMTDEGDLYSANRWAKLGAWLALSREQGFHLDGRTCAVIDIDKTALGAKGRNDHVIDKARLEGIFRTMTAVLGEDGFDQPLFVEHYNELNRGRYHFLTGDNQDYLAYICLVLNTGLISYEELLDEIQQNSLANFDQFIRWVDSRMMINETGSETLMEVHQAILSSVRNGDPTPFKQFRRREFLCTVEHMGQMPDDSPVDELLNQEITLTEEVCQAMEWLTKRGCFVLCLSDKPDEASRPTGRSLSEIPPIHRATTHRIGNDLRGLLVEIS